MEKSRKPSSDDNLLLATIVAGILANPTGAKFTDQSLVAKARQILRIIKNEQ